MTIRTPRHSSRLRIHRLLRLAILSLVAALLPAVTHAQTVPDAVQVPDGQVLLFRAFAAGSQNYECQIGADGSSTWTFRQPHAELTGEDGAPLGIHGRGPFWAGFDGSSVTAGAAKSAPAADPAHDVPWLLLRATSSDTEGRFAGVSYVQRLDTRGGVAPSGPCDTANATLAVPYLAVYYFYGPEVAAAGE
jgi:hypothetical protein